MNKQLEQFQQQIKNGQLAQSFLVIGPEKTGKFSTVIKMIGALNDLSDRELKLARKGELADIILLQTINSETDKKNVSNDTNQGIVKDSGKKGKNKKNKKKISGEVISKKQLDKAIGTIGLKNFQLFKKVLIIRDADKLTHTATNSLLKLIEEPQKDLIIFLLVNNEDDVLATIKSRCQKINFFIQDSRQIEDILKVEFELTDEILDKIIKLSGGRIDLARNYAQNIQKIDLAFKTRDEFRKSLTAGKIEQFKLVDKIIASEDNLLWILNEWIWYLKDFLEQSIQKNNDRAVLKRVYVVLDQLLKTRGLIKTTNVNKKVQLENFFVQI
jgi:DNA polymerase III delta prime subunit